MNLAKPKAIEQQAVLMLSRIKLGLGVSKSDAYVFAQLQHQYNVGRISPKERVFSTDRLEYLRDYASQQANRAFSFQPITNFSFFSPTPIGSLDALIEEVEELKGAVSLAEIVDESADVIHFVEAFVASHGLTLELVLVYMNWKRHQRDSVGKDKKVELRHAANLIASAQIDL